MPFTEIAPQSECPAGVLAWTLPDILQEVEIEAGPEFVCDLIRAFETDAENRLRDARGAAQGGDRMALRKQCHSLKGSSRQMGATDLADLYEDIEHLIDSQAPIGQIGELLDRAAAAFFAVSRQMNTYLE